MAICKICRTPNASGYGTTHFGWCDNLPKPTLEERGIGVVKTPCGDREVLQFYRLKDGPPRPQDHVSSGWKPRT